MRKFADIRIIQCSEDSFFLDKEAFTGEFTLGTKLGIQFQYNIANRIFKTTARVIFNKSENIDKPVLDAFGSVMFEIKASSVDTYTVDDEIVFPTEFLEKTAQLATGMLRGIVTSHMTSEGLAPAIIPILEADDLEMKPMVLKIK